MRKAIHVLPVGVSITLLDRRVTNTEITAVRERLSELGRHGGLGGIIQDTYEIIQDTYQIIQDTYQITQDTFLQCSQQGQYQTLTVWWKFRLGSWHISQPMSTFLSFVFLQA